MLFVPSSTAAAAICNTTPAVLLSDPAFVCLGEFHFITRIVYKMHFHGHEPGLNLISSKLSIENCSLHLHHTTKSNWWNRIPKVWDVLSKHDEGKKIKKLSHSNLIKKNGRKTNPTSLGLVVYGSNLSTSNWPIFSHTTKGKKQIFIAAIW